MDLVQLEEAVYEEHDLFTPPDNPDGRIWRYLDFAKYVSLLEHQALFFATVEALDDPFEGTVPVRDLDVRPILEAMRDTVTDEEVALARANIVDTVKLARSFWCVSCWHQNDYESAAMWSVYASQGQGIAIVSSFNRLTQSFNYPQPIFVGMVQYIDYDNESIEGGYTNVFAPLLMKRRSFEHEKELRAVVGGALEDVREDLPVGQIQNIKVAKYGVQVPIDLNSLIEKVYVAPRAQPWYRELVEQVSQRYGLNVPIIQSDLAHDPML